MCQDMACVRDSFTYQQAAILLDNQVQEIKSFERNRGKNRNSVEIGENENLIRKFKKFQ